MLLDLYEQGVPPHTMGRLPRQNREWIGRTHAAGDFETVGAESRHGNFSGPPHRNDARRAKRLAGFCATHVPILLILRQCLN